MSVKNSLKREILKIKMVGLDMVESVQVAIVFVEVEEVVILVEAGVLMSQEEVVVQDIVIHLILNLVQ